jgi:hypothetical protein
LLNEKTEQKMLPHNRNNTCIYKKKSCKKIKSMQKLKYNINLTCGLISSVKLKGLSLWKTQKERMAKKRGKGDKLKRNQSLTLRVAASSSFVLGYFHLFLTFKSEWVLLKIPLKPSLIIIITHICL